MGTYHLMVAIYISLFFPNNQISILQFNIFMSSSSCFISLLSIATFLTKFSPTPQYQILSISLFSISLVWGAEYDF